MRKTILLLGLIALTIGICNGYYPPFYNNYQPKPYYNRNYVQQRQYYRRPQPQYRRPYYPRYRYDDDDDRYDDHDDWDDHYDSD